MTGTDKSCMGKSLACSVWLCVRIHIMAGMDLYYMQIPRFCRAVCHGHMIRIHLYYIQISRFCHVLRHGHMIRIHLYYIQIPRLCRGICMSTAICVQAETAKNEPLSAGIESVLRTDPDLNHNGGCLHRVSRVYLTDYVLIGF